MNFYDIAAQIWTNFYSINNAMINKSSTSIPFHQLIKTNLKWTL